MNWELLDNIIGIVGIIMLLIIGPYFLYQLSKFVKLFNQYIEERRAEDE